MPNASNKMHELSNLTLGKITWVINNVFEQSHDKIVETLAKTNLIVLLLVTLSLGLLPGGRPQQCSCQLGYNTDGKALLRYAPN